MNEIQKLEQQIYNTYEKLVKLRREAPLQEVKNYSFQTLNGETSLLDLFGERDTLFMIHNMGQGCRYCTLWADGLNAFLPHLESQFSVVLTSKDSPELQRRFANDRQWRFRMVSHGGGDYIQEQSVGPAESESTKNYPGVVCYVKKDNKVFKKNANPFGPGDEFCSLWNLISLAGYDENGWTPQYHYWKRPEKMDDGGQNLN